MRVKGIVGSVAVVAALAGSGPVRAQSAGWERDFFASGVLGEWSGTGTIRGREVTLGRIWRIDVAGHYLRADMSVHGPGEDDDFRALGYWTRTGEHAYRIVWTDERGVERNLVAYGDPEVRSVVAHYHLREFGGRTTLRRVTFRIEGPERYLERVEARRGDAWDVVAEFRLTRSGDGSR